MIKEYVEQIKNKDGCVYFAPAKAEDIEAINNKMKEFLFAEIPAEYKEFLSLTNGIIYDGIEFFGCRPQIRNNYTFPDLIKINQPYSEYAYFSDKIIIGRISESFIVYNSPSNDYAMIDRLNLLTRSEEDSFTELFKNLCEI